MTQRSRRLVTPTGRRYIVFFNMTSKYEGKYAYLLSSSREQAFIDAVEKYGYDVSRVEIETPAVIARLKFLKYEPLGSGNIA